MKLPLLKRKKHKEVQNVEDEVLLALDIGTEFVKAILFQLDLDTSKVKILGYGRGKQHSNAMQGAMIVNLQNVLHACDRAIGLALQHSDKVYTKLKGIEDTKGVQTPLPRRAIVGIAGELVQGITIMADYEREEPDNKIDSAETYEVIEKIKEQAFADAVIDIADEIGIRPEKLVEINTRINATYIDGVKVDNPDGFTGKEVAYKVFSAFGPALQVNSLKEITKQLGIEIISIEEEPYAISRAIKGSRANNYNAVIIDVGGGTSDVAVINNGAIAGTKMFAHGGRVFTKRIAHGLNIDLHEAEEVKLKYSAKTLGDKMEREVKSLLAQDGVVWAEGVQLALEEIEDVDQYPSNFYLCGGGSLLPEMKEALMEYPWLQSLPFHKHPKIEFLFPSQLEDIEDLTESIIDPGDIAPLALARMALEIEELTQR